MAIKINVAPKNSFSARPDKIRQKAVRAANFACEKILPWVSFVGLESAACNLDVLNIPYSGVAIGAASAGYYFAYKYADRLDPTTWPAKTVSWVKKKGFLPVIISNIAIASSTFYDTRMYWPNIKEELGSLAKWGLIMGAVSTGICFVHGKLKKLDLSRPGQVSPGSELGTKISMTSSASSLFVDGTYLALRLSLYFPGVVSVYEDLAESAAGKKGALAISLTAPTLSLAITAALRSIRGINFKEETLGKKILDHITIYGPYWGVGIGLAASLTTGLISWLMQCPVPATQSYLMMWGSSLFFFMSELHTTGFAMNTATGQIKALQASSIVPLGEHEVAELTKDKNNLLSNADTGLRESSLGRLFTALLGINNPTLYQFDTNMGQKKNDGLKFKQAHLPLETQLIEILTSVVKSCGAKDFDAKNTVFIQWIKDNKESLIKATKIFTPLDYRKEDFDIKSFKNEFNALPQNLQEYISQNKIELNAPAEETTKILAEAFNKLIEIPGLIRLIDSGTTFPESPSAAADKNTRIINKKRLSCYLPCTLHQIERLFKEKEEKWVEIFVNNYPQVLNYYEKIRFTKYLYALKQDIQTRILSGIKEKTTINERYEQLMTNLEALADYFETTLIPGLEKDTFQMGSSLLKWFDMGETEYIKDNFNHAKAKASVFREIAARLKYEKEEGLMSEELLLETLSNYHLAGYDPDFTALICVARKAIPGDDLRVKKEENVATFIIFRGTIIYEQQFNEIDGQPFPSSNYIAGTWTRINNPQYRPLAEAGTIEASKFIFIKAEEVKNEVAGITDKLSTSDTIKKIDNDPAGQNGFIKGSSAIKATINGEEKNITDYYFLDSTQAPQSTLPEIKEVIGRDGSNKKKTDYDFTRALAIPLWEAITVVDKNDVIHPAKGLAFLEQVKTYAPTYVAQIIYDIPWGKGEFVEEDMVVDAAMAFEEQPTGRIIPCKLDPGALRGQLQINGKEKILEEAIVTITSGEVSSFALKYKGFEEQPLKGSHIPPYLKYLFPKSTLPRDGTFNFKAYDYMDEAGNIALTGDKWFVFRNDRFYLGEGSREYWRDQKTPAANEAKKT